MPDGTRRITVDIIPFLANYTCARAAAKFNLLTTPLQKMTCGGFFTAAAFIVSGCLELKLQTTYPMVPASNQMVLTAFDGIDPALGCKLGQFSVFNDRNFTQSIINFDFDQMVGSHNPRLQSKSFPHADDNSTLYIKETVVNCTGTTKINFKGASFQGPPTAIPVSSILQF